MSEQDCAGLFDQVGSGLPGGQVGRADDLADAVLSLVESEFINATVLHVDGGGRIACRYWYGSV
ncbi:hypothetical protein V2K16_13455 [Pseudomonas alliivorans]|uniref:hypothetical protein n=1 Tax=Pseudomonas alliivorans TaxID=2810613 RepID=UPI001AE906A4|nr:hypothetical protein [Pseudomonas alliivorans]MBP0941199.1 hypothetical protein [Pseudomonas alliivorans]MEE4879729.1 hypothetical protein [Pseudomonas alliivorans]MEE4884460.1 hypothetical protein [Pseudomonas alliivorans]MEE4930682.1 hypothetical protein [Pseudomonas alliivorans]MEE4935956.1 hypothetical protein [Pseudomonas alliivorans]